MSCHRSQQERCKDQAQLELQALMCTSTRRFFERTETCRTELQVINMSGVMCLYNLASQSLFAVSMTSLRLCED